MNGDTRLWIDRLYRSEGPKVLATLIRLVGDFDLAEDAVQEAFAAALRQWPEEGPPANPRSWLISTGRFKAIDALRRKAKTTEMPADLPSPEESWDEEVVRDDTLRLIFLCCHPALPEAGQVALTLRDVCGLTTEEIAKAFLSSPTTIAQRIVRAKAKIREDAIPYELPSSDELAARLSSVQRVAYLIYNEGYYASSGYSLLRASLTEEAIRLARLLAELQPSPEVFGLLALMLLQESRRSTRADANGDIVLLSDQDRSKWDQCLINEGAELAKRAGQVGPYALQAAIATVHAQSASTEATDWNEIVTLYDRLFALSGSEVVQLNRAIAVAMRDGPAAGLELIDELLARGKLTEYGLAHASRADLLRRLERKEEASAAYQRALELADQQSERRFLEKRLREMSI